MPEAGGGATQLLLWPWQCVPVPVLVRSVLMCICSVPGAGLIATVGVVVKFAPISACGIVDIDHRPGWSHGQVNEHLRSIST